MHPFLQKKAKLFIFHNDGPLVENAAKSSESMKVSLKIGQKAGILILLLLFMASGMALPRPQAEPVKKVTNTSKKAANPSQTVIKQADEAVVPVFTVKLCQQVFVTFERYFYILSNDKPRHPNTYPIFHSAFFANIFSKTIAINAP